MSKVKSALMSEDVCKNLVSIRLSVSNVRHRLSVRSASREPDDYVSPNLSNDRPLTVVYCICVHSPLFTLHIGEAARPNSVAFRGHVLGRACSQMGWLCQLSNCQQAALRG